MPPKPRTIPPKAFDGSWWILPVYVPYECPNCKKITPDRPAIMRYKRELDFDRTLDDVSSLHNHAWAKAGWLVWWICQACGYEDYGQTDVATTEQTVATTEQIEVWLQQGTHKWERA
jgi:hypothetical protein